MKERFPDIVNIKFTAAVEKELDEVQSGQEDWVHTLHDFYDDFEKTLKKAKTEMDGVKIQLEEDKTDLVCPNCGKPMVVKFGRYGKFIACSGYPECKTVQKIVNDTVQSARSAAARSSRKIEARPCVLRLRQLPEVRFRLLGRAVRQDLPGLR